MPKVKYYSYQKNKLKEKYITLNLSTLYTTNNSKKHKEEIKRMSDNVKKGKSSFSEAYKYQKQFYRIASQNNGMNKNGLLSHKLSKKNKIYGNYIRKIHKKHPKLRKLWNKYITKREKESVSSQKIGLKMEKDSVKKLKKMKYGSVLSCFDYKGSSFWIEDRNGVLHETDAIIVKDGRIKIICEMKANLKDLSKAVQQLKKRSNINETVNVVWKIGTKKVYKKFKKDKQLECWVISTYPDKYPILENRVLQPSLAILLEQGIKRVNSFWKKNNTSLMKDYKDILNFFHKNKLIIFDMNY